jgi:hypothetical protein
VLRTKKKKKKKSLDHGPSRSGRLAQRDIHHRPASTEDVDPSISPPRVARHALHDVGAVGDLEHMGSEGVGAVLPYNYGRHGFVLGSRRTATWAAVGGVGLGTGATGGLGIGVELVVISVRGVLGIGGLVLWVNIRRMSLQVQLQPQEVVEVARTSLVFFIVPHHRHIYSLFSTLFFSIDPSRSEAKLTLVLTQ